MADPTEVHALGYSGHLRCDVASNLGGAGFSYQDPSKEMGDSGACITGHLLRRLGALDSDMEVGS